MNETERYIRILLEQQHITIAEHLNESFNLYVCAEENIKNVQNIRLLQENMTKDWKIIARRHEINALQFAFPNGIAGKEYQAEFNLNTYGLDDIISCHLSGFDDTGLEYDAKTYLISGVPKTSGDISLVLSYKFEGEAEDTAVNIKKISIIINPDPKSLWKDIPSDVNDVYAKVDNIVETASFLDLSLLVASKRGRSHANIGVFRDDDYAYSELQDGWGVVAISDGAGSAVYSRKGSLLACNAVIKYFAANFSKENISLLDTAIRAYQKDNSIKAKLLDIAAPYLSAAARQAYAEIEEFAAGINAPINDFHATLAFLLVKKFPQGYAFLSFAAGDCPIVLVDKSFEWVKPLNKLDVGEYGGGTRFITMDNIFTKDDFEERFNFEFTSSRPQVVLMTDGVYDPKFEVEANLYKPEKWQAFFDDLQGDNPEGINVLSEDGDTIKNLSDWMDFWSSGNHDDRTLVLLF